MSYRSVNPYNGETLREFDEISDEALENAVDTAETCFEAWRQTAFAERAAIATRAADILRRQSEDFARPMTQEMGKRITEARGEVALSADIIDYYASNAERFLATEILQPEAGEAHVECEPIGLLFGVQPWNFPYYQLARFAAPNLMAGNVVMVKHSGTVPQCALRFEQLWLDAGAPPGAYTNVFANYDQVDRLIDDPRVKGVALTGSAEAGKSVAERAGRNLKKSTMELGGSDAFIVLADADLPKTVKWAMWAKLNNMGQCCIAAKRFIVVDAVADDFFEAFTQAMSELTPGDPMNPETTLAPMSTEAALLKLVAQVNRAVINGATRVMGGGRIDRPGSFMQPTILSHITRDNPAFDEEFFGPVALFFRVADADAAVALANDSSFGLGGSVFTRDVAFGQQIARRIETGMVFINQPTWTAANLPFGGIKNSGYGRELSRAGIQEFVNHKLIRVASIDDKP